MYFCLYSIFVNFSIILWFSATQDTKLKLTYLHKKYYGGQYDNRHDMQILILGTIRTAGYLKSFFTR